jgi:hypothetical protein
LGRIRNMAENIGQAASEFESAQGAKRPLWLQ